MPPFPVHIPGKKAGFMGALAAVGKLKHHHGHGVPAGAGYPDAQARLTSLNQDERMEVAIMLNTTPAWHDVAVERISDVMTSAESGKNRIKKLKFARNKTLWDVGDEITRFGVYYVLSGTCQFTRKVRIVPRKEMKDVDPELQVMTRRSHKIERDFEVAAATTGQLLGDEAITSKTYSDTVRAASDVTLIYISLEVLTSRFPNVLERLKLEVVARLKAREMRHANHVQVFADQEEEEEGHVGAERKSRAGGLVTVKMMTVNHEAKRYFHNTGNPIFREGVMYQAGMVPTIAVGEESRPLADNSDHMSFVVTSNKKSSSSSSLVLPSKYRPQFGASRVDQMYRKLWSEDCLTLDTLYGLRDAAIYGTIEGDGVVEEGQEKEEEEAEDAQRWTDETPASRQQVNVTPATPLSFRSHSGAMIEGMSRLDLSMVPQLGQTPRRPQTARRATSTPRDDMYAGIGFRGRLTARPATGGGGGRGCEGRARAAERGALEGTKAGIVIRVEDGGSQSARVVRTKDAVVASPRVVKSARGARGVEGRGVGGAALAGGGGGGRKNQAVGGVGSWADDANGFASPWQANDASGRQSDDGLFHMMGLAGGLGVGTPPTPSMTNSGVVKRKSSETTSGVGVLGGVAGGSIGAPGVRLRPRSAVMRRPM